MRSLSGFAGPEAQPLDPLLPISYRKLLSDPMTWRFRPYPLVKAALRGWASPAPKGTPELWPSSAPTPSDLSHARRALIEPVLNTWRTDRHTQRPGHRPPVRT
jgi:hypothetical protein